MATFIFDELTQRKIIRHNSRTNDNIEMKLGPVTKPDKKNKTTLKKLKITSFLEVVTSLSFFQFLANMELSGSRIPDA